MPDKTAAAIKPAAVETAVPGAPPVRRHPGHRGADVRDTVAEMAAKAHEISMEAGSKMAAAMKEVIGAAAGLSTFTLESARDLVQYMVRRGQMTQDEADRLIRDAEEAWSRKHKGKKPPPRLEQKPKAVLKPVPYSLPKAAPPTVLPHKAGAPALKPASGHKAPAGKGAAHKLAAHKPAAKKAAAKKPAVKKPTAKKPAKKTAKKTASRKTAKPAAKKKVAPKK
jgi:polyhydroxyalkanoate synthesis regulator phasin